MVLSRCNRADGTLPDLCRPRRSAARRPRAFGPLRRPEVGVPSRVRHSAEPRWAACGPVGRVPTGGRRSKPGAPFRGAGLRRLRPCGPRADRRSAFQAGWVIPWSWVAPPAALWAACRPEVGVPSRVCDSAEPGCAACGPAGRVPTGGRRSKPGAPFRGAGLRRLRPCGPRADRRSAFQAGWVIPWSWVAPPAALWAACRPEVGVPSRVCDSAELGCAACGPVGRVPTGGRRSKPGV